MKNYCEIAHKFFNRQIVKKRLNLLKKLKNFKTVDYLCRNFKNSQTMKKLIFLLSFCFAAILSFGQAGTVTGSVTAGDEAAVGAVVRLQGADAGTVTDVDGAFTINDVSEGDYTLSISFVGFETYVQSISVEGDVNIGEIALTSSEFDLESVIVTGIVDFVTDDRRTPVALSTISANEIQTKAVGNVEFPEIMKNTPSVYVSGQTGFGDSQMFMRGFDQINTAFLLNGQPINGMEDGRMYWSNWSGMSDIASAIQIQRGLGSSKLAISSVGGTVNIVTKTIDNKKGGFVRLMNGNGRYQKGSIAYNSGLQNKWAYSVLLDYWSAERKWGDGTFGEGQNYFVSLGYKPNDLHTFNFLITGAPQSHGQRWSQSLETLEATPKFNQHWGIYEGEMYSERLNYYHKPVMNLSWDHNISEESDISSVLYASFGRGGGTGPFSSSSNTLRTEDGQIDWAAIEAVNMSDTDGTGAYGQNYALRSSVNNHQWFGNVTNFETDLSELIEFSLGADFRFYRGDHFRQMVDLYGLNAYNEAFRHSSRPSSYTVNETFKANPWSSLFDFADEDQRVGYDYSENINYQGVFTQVEYDNDVFTTFLQGAISNQSYIREGRWSDLGNSEKVNKIGFNVKGGGSYSFDNSNTVFVNAGYYSRQPFLDNVFADIRYSNDFIEPEIDNEDVLGLEAGYKFHANNFRANLNLYRTSWGNRSLVSVFQNNGGTDDDDTDDFTQRTVERGIEQLHQGIEVDLVYRLSKLTLKGYTSIGDWMYEEIGSTTNFNDDTGEMLSEIDGTDLSAIHVPNAPQTAFGLGADWEIIKGFEFFADYNYFSNIYQRNNFNDSENFLREEIGKLDTYGLFDLGIGYEVGLGNTGGDSIGFQFNTYNTLDNDYINNTDPFGYLNGNGFTWNLSAKYNF